MYYYESTSIEKSNGGKVHRAKRAYNNNSNYVCLFFTTILQSKRSHSHFHFIAGEAETMRRLVTYQRSQSWPVAKPEFSSRPSVSKVYVINHSDTEHTEHTHVIWMFRKMSLGKTKTKIKEHLS